MRTGMPGSHGSGAAGLRSWVSSSRQLRTAARSSALSSSRSCVVSRKVAIGSVLRSSAMRSSRFRRAGQAVSSVSRLINWSAWLSSSVIICGSAMCSAAMWSASR